MHVKVAQDSIPVNEMLGLKEVKFANAYFLLEACVDSSYP